ncbi:ATP-binding protein [Lederbergia sp. NSJ-179]|uniref:sensor histidine kinase n=1 Tax=Lederbergia sp. NSJ-179 TaxID=2931402 RepID=UPI001FD49361|nr:HAMP domain-containing sensor histidine kinase [Lederbergia sp. NSJ-179]MCJ7840439.1 ATP-binding protein [Lederbergia sp. NSJ-179]
MKKILSFVQAQKHSILTQWKEKMLHTPDELLNEWMEDRIQLIFDIFLQAFTLSEPEREEFLKKRAEQVSEKMYNPAVISFFVQNINRLKTELLAVLSKLPIKAEVSLPFCYKFSCIIDSFLFYTLDYISESESSLKEAKKEHEDRLTLLGQMTASFVHEFRNPLTTVHGFIQLLRSDNPDLPYLDIIQGELDDLKLKITQFLMLSKKEITNQEKTVFSLSELFDPLLSFIYPKILESNVQLETNISGKLYINGYAEEIKQVLINIIFNAIEAMTCKVSQPVIKITGHQKEEEIYIKIANSGPKIPENIVQTIFDPFVTTKDDGTGLGLYVCKEIINKHQGKLICTSDEKWTEFTIILPIHKKKTVIFPLQNQWREDSLHFPVFPIIVLQHRIEWFPFFLC